MKGSASRLLLVLFASGTVATSVSFADPRRDAILADLLAQVRKEDPGFKAFSAERGAAFFRAAHQGGKPDTPSCTACHTASPQNKGKTRAGKDIEPMAVSKNPARFTNKEEVEKWFSRNCGTVLGRACTAKEKGDFLTFMMGQ